MKFALALVLVAFVAADSSSESLSLAPSGLGLSGDLARGVLMAYEKIQIARHFSTAGSSYAYILSQAQAQSGKAASLEENDDDDSSFLEMNRDLEEIPSHQLSKISLYGSYELFTGIKRWLHVTIFEASDYQLEFWSERALQMRIQAALNGAQVPAQVTQFLYLRNLRTYIKALKFSYRLQTISHFTMWLEDEIDVGKVLADEKSRDRDLVSNDQADDLIRDKLFAFQAFNSYAQSDLQLTYIDFYLGSFAAQNQQAAQASFLEVEVEEKPFVAAAAFAAPQLFSQYSTWFNLYRTTLQSQAAQLALTSAMSENLAYQKSHDNDPSNDKEGESYLNFARQTFAGFGYALVQMSQIDMWTGTMELFQLYGQPQPQANANAAASA